MSWIRVDLAEGRTAYRPGEAVEGTVSWSLDPTDDAVGSVDVHLLWFTRGKGDRDSKVVATERLEEAPSGSGRREFRLRLPAAPYSVSGKLVSIVWAVEVVLSPTDRAERTEITMSPSGREVLLHPDLEGVDGSGPPGDGS